MGTFSQVHFGATCTDFSSKGSRGVEAALSVWWPFQHWRWISKMANYEGHTTRQRDTESRHTEMRRTPDRPRMFWQSGEAASFERKWECTNKQTWPRKTINKATITAGGINYSFTHKLLRSIFTKNVFWCFHCWCVHSNSLDRCLWPFSWLTTSKLFLMIVQLLYNCFLV